MRGPLRNAVDGSLSLPTPHQGDQVGIERMAQNKARGDFNLPICDNISEAELATIASACKTGSISANVACLMAAVQARFPE